MSGTKRLGLNKGASQEKSTCAYKYIAKLQQTNTQRTLQKYRTQHTCTKTNYTAPKNNILRKALQSINGFNYRKDEKVF